MKKILASIAAITLISGCSIFKTVPRYTPDPENIQALQAVVETPVNIGAFTDASFRKELTCRSLAILKAPDNWTYADVIRYALIDELTQAERYNPESPVTITALLNRIDFETEQGSWIITMTLTSSNGQSMTIEEKHSYNGILFGEIACSQAAGNYMPTLKKFIKNLLMSPEFAELTKDTPPPEKPAEERETGNMLPHSNEEKAAEEKARETGKERIRQPDSLAP